MGESHRLKRSAEKARSEGPKHSDAGGSTVGRAPATPAWAGGGVGAPFALGGGAVQRKVAIGESNDAYERQADHVASRVAAGGMVPQSAISPIAPASIGTGVGQRTAKSDDKKEDNSAAPVQRAPKSEDTKKDPKSAGTQLQRQAKPEEKKKDEKPPSSPVQKQAKPEDKKEDKKKDQKASAAPASVQKESKREKKEDKPAPAVQKQSKPDDKKKDEKPPLPAVQKQTKPGDKKKDEKASAAPVQKQGKPEEKKKDDKPPSSPAVQKESKPDQKKDEKPAAPVQREVRPEDKKKEEVPGTLPVQRAEMDEHRDEGSVQASRAGSAAAPSPSMESVASSAIASKGPGEPLQSATRSTLESRMGTDLSDVRVHNDNAAQSATEALNARAFTHQNDIWLGRGESQSDTRLMAHEATHVVQQTGSVHRQLVQRADKPASGSPDGNYSGKEGEVKKKGASYELTIPELKIPDFKLDKTPKKDLTLPKKTDEPRPDDQRKIWEENAEKGKEIDSKLDAMFKKAPPVAQGGVPTIYTVPKGADNFYVIGSQKLVKQRSLRPAWSNKGLFTLFQVDHIRELQLGGENNIQNMWLLEAEANQSSGRNIKAEKNSRIQKLLTAAKGKAWNKVPDVETARRDFDITFKEVKGGLKVDGKPERRWELSDIQEGQQLDQLQVLDKNQIARRGLKGSPSKIVVYTSESGGGKRVSEGWKENQKQKAIDWHFGKIFHANNLTYDHGAQKGSIHVDAFEGSKLIKKAQMDFDLKEMEGVEYGGFISKVSIKRAIADKLEAIGASPIDIDDAEFSEKGLMARGKLLPTIRPFDKLAVDIVFDGDNIYLSKVFSASDFNFPGPIKVTSGSLELFAGTQGIGAKGDVDFEVERVGQGHISAGATFGEGLTIAGDFEFDTKLFDPAKVHVQYSKGKFSGEGTIGVKPGKVRGIKTATITASFGDGAIDAKGTIQPDIPAVEQADLSMHYDEKSGLIIAGDLQLKKDIPGIAGGSIHAEVTKKEDRYIVKASGEATPKIPGITSKLVVSYDDGLFDASITAGYEKGMLKGSVTLGVTNRPVGDDAQPAGPPPEKASKLTIYGGGSVTLRLAPWLQATAAIKFLPNGEVQVTGRIGLPSVLNIFDEKKVEKNIFKIALDIPILGFSVLGHNVGIFLEIGGGLDLDAGIGPGQLQEVELSVTYNPAHEEDTLVHGHAALHIPAHAGMRLFVSAALGAGIPIVDAKAGLELGGSLGIEGALHAAVDVDWSPKKGLVLDASAEIYAEPKFKFDITGFVLVELDLLFTTKTLYEKRWKLKEVEYGSGLRLGMKLPIHYEEGKPFNVSLSDIQFQVPNIDAMATIKGLFDKIV